MALLSGVDERNYTDLGGVRVVKAIQKRVKTGIPAKLLSRAGDRNFLEPVAYYRWVAPEFFSDRVPTYVYNNKYALLLWGPPKKVVVIENAEIAQSFRDQFLAQWNAAQVPSEDTDV